MLVLTLQLIQCTAVKLEKALLLWVHGRKRYDGQVFVAFLFLYALGRFILEYWRADDRGGLFGLSTSQLIGLALMAVAVGIHVVRSRKPAQA